MPNLDYGYQIQIKLIYSCLAFESVVPFITKTSKASSKSDSMRTAMTKDVADSLGSERHDALIWQVDGGKIAIKKRDGKR